MKTNQKESTENELIYCYKVVKGEHHEGSCNDLGFFKYQLKERQNYNLTKEDVLSCRLFDSVERETVTHSGTPKTLKIWIENSEKRS